VEVLAAERAPVENVRPEADRCVGGKAVSAAALQVLKLAGLAAIGIELLRQFEVESES
jgi:hypothetical protein